MSETRSSEVEEKKVYDKNNLVVNELLAFIQNKVSEMDTTCLVEICCTNFTYGEIINAKSVLARCVSVTITYPRSRGAKNPELKARRHIQSLIRVFEKTDPNHFPTFVAQDFSKFIPISSVNLSLKYLVKDMMVLKDEVYAIRDTVETTERITLDLRRMIADIQKEMAGETSEKASLASSVSDATAKEEDQETKPDQKLASWIDNEIPNRQKTDPSENEINVKKSDAGSVTKDSPDTMYYLTYPERKAMSPQTAYAFFREMEQSVSSKNSPKTSAPQENSSVDPGLVSSTQAKSRSRRRRQYDIVVTPSGKKQQYYGDRD